MSSHLPGRAAVRRTRSVVLAALIGLVVLVCVLGHLSIGSPSSQTRSQAGPLPPRRDVVDVGGLRQPVQLRGNAPGEPPGGLRSRALGAADGEVADGTTVFSDVPAVANLDPALLAALRDAASSAAADGVELDVNSGWRSRDYQQQLFDDAVARYGSEASAARWVARPGTSVHEAGEAVDIGPSSASRWLAGEGAAHGLCQVYDNEPWHFELRPDAVTEGCPTEYADAAHDPRMQQ